MPTTQGIITQSGDLASEPVRNLKTTIQGARARSHPTHGHRSDGRSVPALQLFDEPTGSSQDRVVSLVDDLRERAP